MTPFLIKNSVDDFYSPTLFIIEPKKLAFFIKLWYNKATIKGRSSEYEIIE